MTQEPPPFPHSIMKFQPPLAAILPLMPHLAPPLIPARAAPRPLIYNLPSPPYLILISLISPRQTSFSPSPIQPFIAHPSLSPNSPIHFTILHFPITHSPFISSPSFFLFRSVPFTNTYLSITTSPSSPPHHFHLFWPIPFTVIHLPITDPSFFLFRPLPFTNANHAITNSPSCPLPISTISGLFSFRLHPSPHRLFSPSLHTHHLSLFRLFSPSTDNHFPIAYRTHYFPFLTTPF